MRERVRRFCSGPLWPVLFRTAWISAGLLLYAGASLSRLPLYAVCVPLLFLFLVYENRFPLPSCRPARAFAVLYALAAVIGKTLYQDNTLAALYSFGALLRAAVSAAAVCELVYRLVRRVFRLLAHIADRRAETGLPPRAVPKGSLLLFWGVIFCCWLPCFLSYYPGIFSYDLPAQTRQMLGLAAFTANNPPLHTLLWGLCLRLQEAAGLEALAVYGVGQMLLLSFAMAYCVSYLCKAGCSRPWVYGSLAFFALNPTIALMSFIPVKDALFAVFFLLNTVFFLRLSRPGRLPRAAAVMYVLSALLCCLLRNNAFLMFLLALPVLLILLPGRRKQVLALLLVPLLLFAGFHWGVWPAAGIKSGNTKEAMSVPIQQISRIVAEEGDRLDQGDLEQISRFVDPAAAAESYNPRFADPVKKRVAEKKLRNAVPDFLSLWLRLAWQYPQAALDAFLDLNLPYWYQGAGLVDPYSQRIYIETEQASASDDYFTFERKGWLPALRAFYERVADGSLPGSIPVLSALFSLSFPVWLILFCLFLAASRKKGRQAAFLVPAACYWLPYLFGPVSNFRYIFPLTVLYPLLAAVCLGGYFPYSAASPSVLADPESRT